MVPDCCQRLSRSIILWIESVSVTNLRHRTAICVLMEGITQLRLPTLPHHPLCTPPACPPLLHAIHDITFPVKMVAQNQAVLASYSIDSYKTLANYSSYFVNLAWLQSSTIDSQWVKYFQLVILEISNMCFGLVFLNPVTFFYRLSQL